MARTSITAYVSADQKIRFEEILKEFNRARSLSLSQSEFAGMAINEFLKRYAGNVSQLLLDLGLSQ